MPYEIKHDSYTNKWAIIRKDDGRVVGTSDSKEKAEASVRARYAHEDPKNR